MLAILIWNLCIFFESSLQRWESPKTVRHDYISSHVSCVSNERDNDPFSIFRNDQNSYTPSSSSRALEKIMNFGVRESIFALSLFWTGETGRWWYCYFCWSEWRLINALVNCFSILILTWAMWVNDFNQLIQRSCLPLWLQLLFSNAAKVSDFKGNERFSVASFVTACNLNVQCRTFDYDSLSGVCRLFEGSINTGSLISAVATSRVASVQLDPKFYASFGQSCSNCMQTRYLTCSNATCQCPPHFFWNGGTCQNQGFSGAPCNGSQWCRTDQYGLICSVANTCASKTWRPISYRNQCEKIGRTVRVRWNDWA